MFDCIGGCGRKRLSERHRVFVGAAWCEKCVNAEDERSAKEDVTGTVRGIACMRSRPPKYMLAPGEWKHHGYDG